MNRFLLKWFINIIALAVVIHVVAGVSADSWESIIVAALILGLLNAFLRPFIIMLTLPITILSFGFFTLIINGLMFYLAATFVKGFTVIGFWNAFWAAILFSIISFLLNMLLGPGISMRMSARRYASHKSPRYYDAIDVEGKVEDLKKEK